MVKAIKASVISFFIPISNFMRYYIFFFALAFITLSSCKSQNTSVQENKPQKELKHEFTNDLIHESSPYLLQHAHNPVNWRPWGKEALDKAKKENKLLLISVGYAACHWCHVMEHESFEDTLIARMMNEHFIPIKVDREERPDVDDVYMTACHMSSGGSCGWPLNAFAMPDGRPIYAATYFPKEDWKNVLQQFIDLKKKDPSKLEGYAVGMTKTMKEREVISINVGDPIFKVSDIKSITNKMVDAVDMKKGGRKTQGGRGNKFPMPNNWQYLLREHQLTQNTKALKAAEVTLDQMAAGGIYDHLGGGFARYSTDPEWKAPHFEKMLYDNGQLISLYSLAYQATKKDRYKEVVLQSLDFIEREMTHRTGGFYSSYDADSEGEEGKFYVWDKEEVVRIINDKMTSDIFCEYYNIYEGGNWEHTNIVFNTKTLKDICKRLRVTESKAKVALQKGRKALFQARTKRIYPGLDDKILTSWNALMLKGYVDAYRAFGDPSYKKAALKNANFLITEVMQKDGRLNRNYKDGKSVINAFLDDYALTIEAFVALYEITYDEKWLNNAKLLLEYTISQFYDKDSGMFYYTSNLDDPLIVRKMETSDNVIPASNSSMAKALFLIGTYFYNNDYINMSEIMVNNMKNNIIEHPQPTFFSNWATVMSMLATPPYEIAIVGENAEALSQEMQKEFLPNALFLGGETEGNLELLKDKLVEGETYIYVCRNKACLRPVTTVKEALELMKK